MIKLDCLTNWERFLRIVAIVFWAAMVWVLGLRMTTAAVILVPDSPSSHRPSGVLQAFNYADVTLTGGPVEEQAQFSREFYLAIPNDNLLNGFRLRAGLPAPGKAMGGWYDPENFAGGCTFGQLISALNGYAPNPAMNVYVQSAKLNGQLLNRPWITHQEIVKGGTLELEMGILPNKNWGTKIKL